MAWQLIVLIVILIISTVLQYTLTPKPGVEKQRPKGLGDFNFPTATEDRSIPIMWGTIDIRGPNVLWYGDFKTVRRQHTKGGAKILLAFNYYVGIDLLLCYGPVDRITRLEISDKVYPVTEDVSGSPVARVSPAFPVTPTAAGLDVVFSAEKALGGLTKGGTVSGTMKMFNGDPSQLRSTYLQSQLGTNIPAYVNIAHVVGEQIQVGERTSIGNYVFRVTRFPNNLGLDPGNHIVRGTVDDGDANPMEILYEVLTSELWGLALDPSRVDIASFTAAGNTLATEQNGMSWIITSTIAAIDIIKEITRQVDAVFFEDAAGLFCVRLVRDDYTPAALPLFDESNISKLNDFSRASWSGTQNHVNIGYSDRSKDFQDTGAMSQDLANVRIQSAEVRGDYQYPGVKHADTAQQIAERELRVLSFPLAQVKFITNRDGAFLIPGDVVRFSWGNLGIAEMVVRVMKVDLGDIDKGQISVTGIQDVFRVAESIYKAPNDTGWTRPSDTAEPLIAGEEFVREMPRIFGNLYPSDIVDPVLARTWNMVRRPSAQPTTLGVEIFVDDGGGGGFLEGFGDIGLIPLATLDLEYPAATADIEVSDLLSIDNAIEFANIGTAVASQIAAGFNLVLIEGATQAEDEVIGFESLVDDGDGTYKLRNAHRGLFDTQARTHLDGARVWFFAEEPAFSSSTFGDTAAINVRHVPETTTDTLDVFEATSLPLTFAQRTLRPHHPANFTVNATRVPVATDETADLDFDWEHRPNADLTVKDADDGTIVAADQDTDVEYILQFKHAVSGVSLRIETLTSASSWLTFLYTQALLQSDTGEVGNFPLEAIMHAKYKAVPTNGNPADLTSLQTITRQFNADMGGGTVQSINLDGTTEYLAHTAANIVGLVNTFSVNVWVRGVSNVGGTQRDIFHIDPAASNNNRISLVLTDDSNGSAFNVQLYNSAGTLTKDYDFGSFTVNTWTMLTFTWDGTDLTVYQDGAVDASPTKNTDISGTLADAGRRIIVGGDTTPAASWAGFIFSPATWTTELLAAEITSIDAGTSAFNLRENSGNYASRATMNHMWDFRTSVNIGADYRNFVQGGVLARDIDTNAANISAADLDAVEIP